jgi:hypothetical protein
LKLDIFRIPTLGAFAFDSMTQKLNGDLQSVIHYPMEAANQHMHKQDRQEIGE